MPAIDRFRALLHSRERCAAFSFDIASFVFLAFAAACGTGFDRCKDGPDSELLVVLGPDWETATVTTRGACTAVERTDRNAQGNTIWHGSMTATDAPCTVTVVRNGEAHERTVQGGELCGRPEPKSVCFGVNGSPNVC